MSDADEVEVNNPSNSWPVLPKEVAAEIGSTKLFNSEFSQQVGAGEVKLTAGRVVLRGR